MKPGVRFLQETITAIDPEARRVTTDAGTHEADALVVALGADYDMAATPGMAESGDEFYSFEGAVRMRDAIRDFTQGPRRDRRLRRAVQVPAGAERVRAACCTTTSSARGVRGDCEITLVLPVRPARAAVARDVGGAGRRVRGARHPLRRRAPR